MDQSKCGWKIGQDPPIWFQQVAKPCVVDFREEIKRESGIHIEEYKRKCDCRLNLGLTGQMAHLSLTHQD